MTGTAYSEWEEYYACRRKKLFWMRIFKGSVMFILGSVMSYFVTLTILTPTHERHETICVQCHTSGYSWRNDREAPAHAAIARKKYVRRFER